MQTYTQVTLYRPNRLYVGMYVCMQDQLVKEEAMDLKESVEEYIGEKNVIIL